MNDMDYYKEKFKSTMSEEDLQKLIERDEAGERVSDIEEMKELFRATGRKAIEAMEKGIEAKKEIEKYNKENSTNIEFPDWVLEGDDLDVIDKIIDGMWVIFFPDNNRSILGSNISSVKKRPILRLSERR